MRGKGYLCIYKLNDWGEDIKKREPLGIVGGNINWCGHCGKQYAGSSKKLKLEQPYDPAIPLWIYILKGNEITITKRYQHSHIAALFTIAETWKQPKYPSVDDRRKEM